MDLSVLETETAKMAEVAKAEPQAQEVAATEPVQTEVEDEDEPENEGSQGGAVPGVEPAAGETFEPPSRVDRERAASGETEEPPSMTAIDVTTLTIEDAKRDFEATQQEIYARHDASQKDGIVLLFTADDLYETGEARTLVTAMSNKFTLQVAADKSVPYAHVRGKAADAPAVIQSALVEAEKRGLNVRKIVTRLSAATTRDVLDSVTPALERLGNKQVTLKVDMRGKKPAETLYHMVKIEDLSLRIGYELGAEPIGRALHEITNLPMPQCIALAEDIIRFAKKIIELKPIARADLEADISNAHRAARTALTSL
jgi:hypothetical protein